MWTTSAPGSSDTGPPEADRCGALTYSEVGATRAAGLPGGYRHLELTARLGQGTARDAGERLLAWRLHRQAGIGLRAAGPAQVGQRVETVIGMPPLAIVGPCAVVWVERGPHRWGFGYGTLPGHPVTGEEAFVVAADARGRGVLRVRAFSRPATSAARLAGPLLPLGQRAYLHHLALCDRVRHR